MNLLRLPAAPDKELRTCLGSEFQWNTRPEVRRDPRLSNLKNTDPIPYALCAPTHSQHPSHTARASGVGSLPARSLLAPASKLTIKLKNELCGGVDDATS